MPGLEKLAKKVNACVTCDYWKGELRNPTPDRFFVVYESFQRGVCTGPLKTGKSMTPLNKCKAWRIWAQLKKPKDTDDSIFGEQSNTWWDLEEFDEFIPDRDTESLRPSTYVQEILRQKREADQASAEVASEQPAQVQAEATVAQEEIPAGPETQEGTAQGQEEQQPSG